ncbi:MAG: hypothetical protein SVG88_03165 [Halobacteriales archaeon]|nr:hypothetical protein [Halobacteriales archaeon]
MDVLGDLVARDRELDGTVLQGAATDRSYAYHRFATTTMKAGNFLRQHGVGIDVPIGIADERLPEPLLALFGGLLLGATVRFDPPTSFEGRVVVTRTERVDDYSLPDGGTVIAYGEEPADPATAYFERGIWSENPAFPPTAVDPETAAIRTAETTFSHGTLLTAATQLVKTNAITTADTVALCGSLTTPAVLVAGVFAPLLAGGTIRLVPESGEEPSDLRVDGTDRLTKQAADAIAGRTS